jgi:hypothetical protein
MTQRRFYLIASLAPLAIPLCAAAFALPQLRGQPASVGVPVRVAFLVFLTGVYSTIPYLVFLIVGWFVLRSADPRAYRRIAWLAPIIIAIPFAPLFALTTGTGDGFVSFGRAVLVGGAWALAVGYVYVAILESIRAAGTRAGWIG